LLNKALPSSKVDKIHKGEGLEQSYFGKDVIVGVVDYGFDFTHPMFQDANGNCRFKRAWVSGDEGTPPEGSEYGNLLTENEIYDYQFSSKASHGTHVLGIAAGSAVEGLKNNYSGVASEADIAVVELGGRDIAYSGLSIAEGLAYLFSYADSVNKPIVVNMSLGYSGVYRDGSYIVDLLISEMLNENPDGRILVVSAGNEGDIDMHFQHDFSQKDSIVAAILFENIEPTWKGSELSICGEAGDEFAIDFKLNFVLDEDFEMIDFAIDSTIFSINTAKDTAFEVQFAIEFLNIEYSEIVEKYYTIDVEVASANMTGRPYVRLEAYEDIEYGDITDNDFLLFSIKSNDAKIHFWNEGGTYTYSNDVNVNSYYTISPPGTVEEVITVGAYDTRDTIIQYHYDEPIENPWWPTLDSITYFSSKGPLLNGSIKPDIVAPGNTLYSAYNYYDEEYSEDDLNYFTVDYDNSSNKHRYITASGTSMSAPMVTGIVALMLEINPQLTQSEIKDILQITAINDEFTGEVRNNKDSIWGWGKINAHGIMQNLENVSVAEEQNFPFLIYPNPAISTNFVNIQLENSNLDLPFVVNIYDESGKLVYLTSLQNEKTLDLSHLPAGFYFVKLFNTKANSTQKLVISK
jgi:subtilisin family serine protease